MRVENGGVFRAKILRHLALHFLELFAGADEGLLEAVEFAGDFRLGHIAALHALRTLELLSGPPEFSSLLLTLARVPDVFDEPYRTHRFRIPKSPECLLCSADPATAAGEDLDAALDRALARLAHE